MYNKNVIIIGNDLHIVPSVFEMFQSKANLLKENKNKLLFVGKEDSIDLIERDLHRTFGELCLFSKDDGPLHDHLKEILQIFACYRPELGYVQGMTYIAGIICLFISDSYTAFSCFSNLIVSRNHLFDFFQFNINNIQLYYTCFEEVLVENSPQVYNKIKDLEISSNQYLFLWLQTVFLKVLPLTTACRVWDNFIYEGNSFLFKTAVAILKLFACVICNKDFFKEFTFENCIRYHTLYFNKYMSLFLIDVIE